MGAQARWCGRRAETQQRGPQAFVAGRPCCRFSAICGATSHLVFRSRSTSSPSRDSLSGLIPGRVPCISFPLALIVITLDQFTFAAYPGSGPLGRVPSTNSLSRLILGRVPWVGSPNPVALQLVGENYSAAIALPAEHRKPFLRNPVVLPRKRADQQ